MNLFFPVPTHLAPAVKAQGLAALQERLVVHGCTKPGTPVKGIVWVELDVSGGQETLLLDADVSDGRQWYVFDPSTAR